jgi:hypothetical protein
MGNFSRNTFDASKHYVGVRIQQGVPLVDADWNEMEDVRRAELRNLVRWSVGDGIPMGNDGFRIVSGEPAPNDFIIMSGFDAQRGEGRCFVDGWEAVIETDVRYSGQALYQNDALAAKWQVDPLPPLESPPAAGARTDLVYLDVWEREVDKDEDPALMDERIGVTTCVRTKREWVVRVAGGVDTTSAPPPGHAFYPLASLARSQGGAAITPQQITDLRFTGLTLVRSFGATGRVIFKSIVYPAAAENISAPINPGLGPGPLSVMLGVENPAGLVFAGERGDLTGDFPDVSLASIVDARSGLFQVKIKAQADVGGQDLRVRWWAGMPSMQKPDVEVHIGTSVWIEPQDPSVISGTTRQFTATISGNTDTRVSWYVNEIIGGSDVVGRISQTGLYSAPSSPCTVVIKAVSLADTTKWATTRVTVSDLSVVIAPRDPQVSVGMSIDFMAHLNGVVNNQAVKWLINEIEGGNSSLGTISSLGHYAAPTTVPPSVVTVKAVSKQAVSKYDSTRITVSIIRVGVTPAASTLLAGRTCQFAANVSGTMNTEVEWLVNEILLGNATVGTITAAGLYTAPAAVPSPNTVIVKARLKTDTSKYGTAGVTISVVSVSLNSSAVDVSLGKSFQFAAAVAGTANQAVDWMVNDRVGGDAAVGTITVGGLYTAPSAVPSPNSVTVKAKSTEDTSKWATAAVTVRQVTVSISPPSASLRTGLTRQFTVSVHWTDVTTVTWKVNGIVGGNATVGRIAAGLYKAPDTVPSPAKVTVSATSIADPAAFAEAAVTVIADIIVEIKKDFLPLQVGDKEEIAVHANDDLAWSLFSVSTGVADPGQIKDGVYTAPRSIPSLYILVGVRAVSKTDASKFDTAIIAVLRQAPTFDVNPLYAEVSADASRQFATTIANVDWFVNLDKGGSAANGKITQNGLYTAPGGLPTPRWVLILAVVGAIGGSVKFGVALVQVTLHLCTPGSFAPLCTAAMPAFAGDLPVGTAPVLTTAPASGTQERAPRPRKKAEEMPTVKRRGPK